MLLLDVSFNLYRGFSYSNESVFKTIVRGIGTTFIGYLGGKTRALLCASYPLAIPICAATGTTLFGMAFNAVLDSIANACPVATEEIAEFWGTHGK